MFPIYTCHKYRTTWGAVVLISSRDFVYVACQQVVFGDGISIVKSYTRTMHQLQYMPTVSVSYIFVEASVLVCRCCSHTIP